MQSTTWASAVKRDRRHKAWNIVGWIVVCFIVFMVLAAILEPTTVTTTCDPTYTTCTTSVR